MVCNALARLDRWQTSSTARDANADSRLVGGQDRHKDTLDSKEGNMEERDREFTGDRLSRYLPATSMKIRRGLWSGTAASGATYLDAAYVPTGRMRPPHASDVLHGPGG